MPLSRAQLPPSYRPVVARFEAITSAAFGIMYGLSHHVALTACVMMATVATACSGCRRSHATDLNARVVSGGSGGLDHAPAEHAVIVVEHH